jgi:hypothetical protein
MDLPYVSERQLFPELIFERCNLQLAPHTQSWFSEISHISVNNTKMFPATSDIFQQSTDCEDSYCNMNSYV